MRRPVLPLTASGEAAPSPHGEAIEAFIYIKSSVVYRGPPSTAYLAAIGRMLLEAGHNTEVVVRYVSSPDKTIKVDHRRPMSETDEAG